jgi:anti-sigma factor ChrR (cupin superfamily)
VVSEDAELDRLRKEVAELRALVRALSASLARTAEALPLDAALALARGGETVVEPPLRLENWNETIEMTRADVLSDMAALWQRLPPRENA